MLATQYDDEVEATLLGVVVLVLVEVTGRASTGEIETERRRTRRVMNSAAAEKVTMMMRVFVLSLWWQGLVKIGKKDLMLKVSANPRWNIVTIGSTKIIVD